ncbi:MAG: AmpG family muropeptide MFS transporter, partial [Rhodocyclaceae bacterium]|nr:AmpG family muropeptide MFS transporter [Rhodocyclaceae bacterium]
MLVCIVMGFVSGMPLYLLFNLLPAWLRTEGLSLKTIGAFALIQFPYTWKFLWAPLLDRFGILPRLGRRRSWMLVTQLGLVGSIAWLGQLSPTEHLPWVVAVSAGLALFSATQDIALDALRREILPDEELGLGNAMYVNAYRISGLVPGSLSLILADRMPWDMVFLITALFMLPGIVMTLMIREPAVADTAPRTLRDAVVEPFHEFFSRHGVGAALLVLAFMLFYKLGDSLCTALATPFYLDMGYSKTEIGLIAKNAGLWPMVAGGILGGIWMIKLGINRALWLFGVVQVVTILGFAWLAWLGPAPSDSGRLVALALVIAGEAIGAGLGTTAFVAFMARTTHPAYTATQLALFTSLMAVPRTFINAT